MAWKVTFFHFINLQREERCDIGQASHDELVLYKPHIIITIEVNIRVNMIEAN